MVVWVLDSLTLHLWGISPLQRKLELPVHAPFVLLESCKGARHLGHGNQWELSPKQELGAHMWRSELWYSNQEKTCNTSTGNINTRLIKLLLNSSARQIWADLLFKGKVFNYLLILTSTGDPRSTYQASRILFRTFWITFFSCLWSIHS